MTTTAASEELMNELHQAMVRRLIKLISDNEISAAEMSVARGLLKDSAVTCSRETESVLNDLEVAMAQRRANRRGTPLQGSAVPLDFSKIEEDADFLTRAH